MPKAAGWERKLSMTHLWVSPSIPPALDVDTAPRCDGQRLDAWRTGN